MQSLINKWKVIKSLMAFHNKLAKKKKKKKKSIEKVIEMNKPMNTLTNNLEDHERQQLSTFKMY